MSRARLSSPLVVFLVGLNLVGCPSDPMTRDAAVETPNDAFVPRGQDAPSPDAFVPLDSSTDGGGPGLDVEDYCRRRIGCSPGTTVTVEECVVAARGRFSAAQSLGCAETWNAATLCELAQYDPDAGRCTWDPWLCDAEFTAQNQCAIAATGVSASSCRDGYVCTHTSGTPDASCVIGAPVESCDTSGAVGTCVRDLPGGMRSTASYYEPLPVGVTLEVLATTCLTEVYGRPGVWTEL